MSASSWSSSLPAAPTNGTPCLSSWKPGASPTNIRSAAGKPDPKTTCVRPLASAHLVQPATLSRYAARLRPAGSVAATAAASTAAASSRTEARLGGARAVGREDRELLLHL